MRNFQSVENRGGKYRQRKDMIQILGWGEAKQL